MNLNAAYDEKEERRRRESVELCGKNRGPHDYMPIEWVKTETTERVTRLLCRICFCNIGVKEILENYPSFSLDK